MDSIALDPQISAEILQRAAQRSGLSVVIGQDTPVRSTKHELLAYVISPTGAPITADQQDLVETAAGQVAREMVAEAVRVVQSRQRGQGPDAIEEVAVPTTGQPFAQDRPDVRGLKLMGDIHAIRITLGAITVAETSSQAYVECDTDTYYNASMAGGAVIRLRIDLDIEISNPETVGVVDAEAQDDRLGG